MDCKFNWENIGSMPPCTATFPRELYVGHFETFLMHLRFRRKTHGMEWAVYLNYKCLKIVANFPKPISLTEIKTSFSKFVSEFINLF